MVRSGGTWLHTRLCSHFECLVSRRVKRPFRDVLALKWHTRCSQRQHAASALAPSRSPLHDGVHGRSADASARLLLPSTPLGSASQQPTGGTIGASPHLLPRSREAHQPGWPREPRFGLSWLLWGEAIEDGQALERLSGQSARPPEHAPIQARNGDRFSGQMESYPYGRLELLPSDFVAVRASEERSPMGGCIACGVDRRLDRGARSFPSRRGSSDGLRLRLASRVRPRRAVLAATDAGARAGGSCR